MSSQKIKVIIYLISVKCILAQNENNKSLPNNVCPTWEDYFTMNNNKNCWHNPDINKNAEEIISSKGYPLEKYVVTTEDGYLLDLYRLPRKENNKGIIFLQHPVTADFTCWVVFDKNNSFAYFFYDAGYDVWMGNARGTEHGRRHLTLSPDDKTFWDFSFHEIGIYDMPAIINFIRLKTNYMKKITAIGHSMGGTDLIVYATMLPKHAEENLNLIVPISAGVRYKHIRSIGTKFISSLMNLNILKFLEDVGFYEVRENGPVHMIRKIFCNRVTIGHVLCHAFEVFTNGMSYENDPALQPVAHNWTPLGFSVKSLFHYAQAINSSKFAFFDYGRMKNLELYGQETPPEYPIKNITVPTFLIGGGQDIVDTIKDLKEVFYEMPEVARQYGYLEIKQANHFDTLYSRYIRRNVLEPLLKLIDRINK